MNNENSSSEASKTQKTSQINKQTVLLGVAAILTLLIIILAIAKIVSPYKTVHFSDPQDVSDYIRSYFCIIHAGGQLTGADGKNYTYTNSLDSLENMYLEGNRVVELDFAFTTDDKAVCLHRWSDTCYTNKRDNTNASLEGHPISYDEFMSVKINGYFAPMSLDDVLSFMEKHKDLVLITDIKETFDENGVSNDEVTRLCTAISEKAPDLKNRIVIQIYREDQYDQVKALGFENMIYTLYMLSEDEKLDATSHLEFSAAHPLVGFTFEKKYLKNKDFYKAMKKTDVPLFVHTVSKKGKMNSLFNKKKVAGIYTNVVNNRRFKTGT